MSELDRPEMKMAPYSPSSDAADELALFIASRREFMGLGFAFHLRRDARFIAKEIPLRGVPEGDQVRLWRHRLLVLRLWHQRVITDFPLPKGLELGGMEMDYQAITIARLLHHAQVARKARKLGDRAWMEAGGLQAIQASGEGKVPQAKLARLALDLYEPLDYQGLVPDCNSNQGVEIDRWMGLGYLLSKHLKKEGKLP